MNTDLFSKQALDYSRFRPQYPAELYRYLSVLCRGHDRAWDVATGNGQAAIELARTFQEVVATDLSAEQILHAKHAPNIIYHARSAEEPQPEPDESFDLITVATGLHWFDREKFFPEAVRLLKPGGIFAAWAYGFHSSISNEIDRELHHFYYETLKGYWRSNNQLVWNGYKDIEMPFHKIQPPKIKMSVEWSIEEFLGYCSTWSAVQLYKDDKKTDPTEILRAKLTVLWGNQKRDLQWSLGLIVGRK